MPADLSAMFATPTSAFALFDWLRTTFNGDLFPMDDPGAEREQLTAQHLGLIRDFVEGRSLIPERHGQGRLFRFRFNAIPVDLVSSIYQQFARTSAADEARSQGLHYTPVELVHLTLDPVFEGLAADARVVDPACGSGAFLVEAFRRLVWRASAGKLANRQLVRRILYRQLFGIDINRAALGIAAFSLYLAALELDEEPVTDIGDLKFDRLIDTTLFEADSLCSDLPDQITAATFDAVVGNPPWTFVAKDGGTQKRRASDASTLRPRRSPDQAFLALGADLAGEQGRVGMVMKATPFFSKDTHAVAARTHLLERLAPVALINLSYLRREELFPDAVGPALLFFARCALGPDPDRLLVGSIPWTPDFRRTGVFHLGPGEIRSVPLKRVLATPRKARGSRSRRTKKLVIDSYEENKISGKLMQSVDVSFGFVAPPQLEQERERVRRLAQVHLQGFFYLITYDEARKTGGFIPGSIGWLNEASRRDWGNSLQRGFADLTLAWHARVEGTGAAGFFKVAIRREPAGAELWSFAL